jgi:hypothetical protein
MDKETYEKFMQNVNKTDTCWIWTGTIGHGGYAFLGWKGKASRLIYEHTYGPFDKNLLVCHKCDNTLCVNPEHMFIGTQKQNMQDASRKGRLKQTDERKKHHSEIMKGHKTSAETRLKIGLANKNHRHSIDAKKKISDARKSKIFSAESIAKQVNALTIAREKRKALGLPRYSKHFTRKPLSEETKLKISMSRKATNKRNKDNNSLLLS